MQASFPSSSSSKTPQVRWAESTASNGTNAASNPSTPAGTSRTFQLPAHQPFVPLSLSNSFLSTTPGPSLGGAASASSSTTGLAGLTQTTPTTISLNPNNPNPLGFATTPGVTLGGGPGANLRAAGISGDDGEFTPSSAYAGMQIGGLTAGGVGGGGGMSSMGGGGLEGDDELFPAMADDDYSAQLSWQSQSKDNLKVLMESFTPDQYDRFEAYRRHALPKQGVRKVIQQCGGQQVSMPVAQIVAGFAKVFVGEMVEKARAVQARRGDTGPLSPDHLREAYRMYQEQTGRVGAARRLRSKKLFVR